MAFKIAMHNMLDGTLVDANLPVSRGTDEWERNVTDGGTASLELAWVGLSDAVKNSWGTYFEAFSRWIVASDPDLAWNHPQAVRYAGTINSVKKTTGKGNVRINCAPMNEYLAHLLVTGLWDETWTEPELAEGEEPPAFKAASWEEMLGFLAHRALNQATAPGQPPVPAVLRNGGVATTTGDAVSIPIPRDRTTYYDLMVQIRDNHSGVGTEWAFLPVFTDESRTNIAFDFVTGTRDAPHINAGTTVTVELSEASTEKISAFNSVRSGTSYSNRSVLRYESPVGTDADPDATIIKMRAKYEPSANPQVPLMDALVEPNAPLTEEQATAYLNAAVRDGKSGDLDAGLTLEEQWDHSRWIGNLGKMISFKGVNNSLSAGDTIAMRLVAVTFSAQKGTMELQFLPKATRYPLTPKQRRHRKAYNPARELDERGIRKLINDFGQKFNGVTGQESPKDPVVETDPGDGGYYDEWTNEGEHRPESYFGSEGRDPGDTAPVDKSAEVIAGNSTATFDQIMEGTHAYPTHDGLFPVDARALMQDEGNRVYGLDHASFLWETLTNATATTDTATYPSGFVADPPIHFNGGVDQTTGEPITGYHEIFIKKTHLSKDGNGNPWETAGKLPLDLVKAAMPEFEVNPRYNLKEEASDFSRGYYLSHWFVNGRYYLAIGAMIYSQANKGVNPKVSSGRGGRYASPIGYKLASSPHGTYETDWWRNYYYNGKITVYSAPVDGQTGNISSAWRTEPWTFHNDTIPLTENITRWGSTVAFGGGPMVIQKKFLNAASFGFVACFGMGPAGEPGVKYTSGSYNQNQNPYGALQLDPKASQVRSSTVPERHGQLLGLPCHINEGGFPAMIDYTDTTARAFAYKGAWGQGSGSGIAAHTYGYNDQAIAQYSISGSFTKDFVKPSTSRQYMFNANRDTELFPITATKKQGIAHFTRPTNYNTLLFGSSTKFQYTATLPSRMEMNPIWKWDTLSESPAPVQDWVHLGRTYAVGLQGFLFVQSVNARTANPSAYNNNTHLVKYDPSTNTFWKHRIDHADPANNFLRVGGRDNETADSLNETSSIMGAKMRWTQANANVWRTQHSKVFSYAGRLYTFYAGGPTLAGSTATTYRCSWKSMRLNVVPKPPAEPTPEPTP